MLFVQRLHYVRVASLNKTRISMVYILMSDVNVIAILRTCLLFLFILVDVAGAVVFNVSERLYLSSSGHASIGDMAILFHAAWLLVAVAVHTSAGR